MSIVDVGLGLSHAIIPRCTSRQPRFRLSDEAPAIACRVPPGQRSEVGACDRALTTDFHKNLHLDVKSKSYKMRIYSLAD
jgi:hypothetical protein